MKAVKSRLAVGLRFARLQGFRDVARFAGMALDTRRAAHELANAYAYAFGPGYRVGSIWGPQSWRRV